MSFDFISFCLRDQKTKQKNHPKKHLTAHNRPRMSVDAFTDIICDVVTNKILIWQADARYKQLFSFISVIQFYNLAPEYSVVEAWTKKTFWGKEVLLHIQCLISFEIMLMNDKWQNWHYLNQYFSLCMTTTQAVHVFM